MNSLFDYWGLHIRRLYKYVLKFVAFIYHKISTTGSNTSFSDSQDDIYSSIRYLLF